MSLPWIRFETGFACVYCGVKPTKANLHVDHIMPTALGGSDDASNLATSCRDCNNGKAASAPDAPTVAAIMGSEDDS